VFQLYLKGNGRPRKSKRTKKSIVNSASQIRTRVLVIGDLDGDSEPSDDDDNPGDTDEYGDVEAATDTPWTQQKDMCLEELVFM